MDQQQQPQNTTLCRGGCGFYGSSATEGLCSKCFKDSIKRKQDTTTTTPRIVGPNSAAIDAVVHASTSSNNNNTLGLEQTLSMTSSNSVGILNDIIGTQEIQTSEPSLPSCDSTQSLPSTISADGSVGTSTSGATKKVNRCFMCKKRVGLTGFTCRCGGLYCGEHRYDQAHNCNFDYKTVEREEIRKNNPVVVSDKIQRI